VADSEIATWRYSSPVPTSVTRTRTWSWGFDVTQYTIVADVAAVVGRSLRDGHAALPALHGDSGPWVVPHPAIQALSDTLWSESADLLDYARRCYDTGDELHVHLTRTRPFARDILARGVAIAGV